MSQGESSAVIIKSEPRKNEVFCIINTTKTEDDFVHEVKGEVDLDYIKEDMIEESLIKAKREKVAMEAEIPISSDEEALSMIMKSEPCNDKFSCINATKVEEDFVHKVKPQVDLEYVKKESLMQVKQEEISLKDEIPISSDIQRDLLDDNIFTVEMELSPISVNAETSMIEGEKRFACTFCQYKTSRKQDLKCHIDCHMEKKTERYVKFRCSECKYETSSKTNLVRHAVVHTKEKRFACNLCKFKTAWGGNVKKHMIKHAGEKPFTCNLCEFKTARKNNLKSHMTKHTGEKPFACNLCEFKTARNHDLTAHKKTHTGEKPFTKPFACNLCELKSAHKHKDSYMMKHTDKHIGEKAFACNLCEFKTTQKGHLKNHMIKHTGEKPFTCNLCEFKSATNQGLTVHKRTHTGGRPSVCNLCEFESAHTHR